MRYFKDGMLSAWRLNDNDTVDYRGGAEEEWQPAFVLNNVDRLEMSMRAGRIEETKVDPFKEYDCLNDL